LDRNRLIAITAKLIFWKKLSYFRMAKIYPAFLHEENFILGGKIIWSLPTLPVNAN